jgi:DNA-binding TFAR19-related protein (PDSD5 family)
VVKRLRKGQTDFAQENGYIYLIKVLNVEYKISPEDRKRILAKIEEEKINEFIKNLKNEAVIKILDKSPKIYLPKGY